MERLTEWKDDKKMLAKPKFRGDFGSQNILQSLAEYEDLEELIGIPLENLAEICNKIPEECRNPKKAIALTDEDVDRWNDYKVLEDRLHKIAFHTGYNKAIDDFVEKINYTAYTPVCVDCMTKNQIIELAEQLKAGEQNE